MLDLVLLVRSDVWHVKISQLIEEHFSDACVELQQLARLLLQSSGLTTLQFLAQPLTTNKGLADQVLSVFDALQGELISILFSLKLG